MRWLGLAFLERNGILRLAASLLVDFGGAGIPRPVGEHRLCPAPVRRCMDDRHDFDPAAAIPERLPEFAVRRSPGAERRRGLVAGIDVNEDGALGVQQDPQPEREAGINLRKSRWDNDLATPSERCVSPQYDAVGDLLPREEVPVVRVVDHCVVKHFEQRLRRIVVRQVIPQVPAVGIASA